MIHIKLDKDANGEEFDRALKNTLPDTGDVSVITKSDGTPKHRAIVLIKFPCQLPDGTLAMAQTVMTAREFLGAANVIRGAHPGTEERDYSDEKVGHTVSGMHSGIGYNAVMIERVYMISIEGFEGIAIAATEDEVRAVAKQTIEEQLSHG